MNRNYPTGHFYLAARWRSLVGSMKREPKSKPDLRSIPNSRSGATATARKATTRFLEAPRADH